LPQQLLELLRGRSKGKSVTSGRDGRPRLPSAGVDSAVCTLLSDGLPGRLAVTDRLCLLSQGFEGQATRQLQKLLDPICHESTKDENTKLFFFVFSSFVLS
jgi:hypothetical protein